MDLSDPHFERPLLLLAALACAALAFAGLRWAERRRRAGLAGFAAERLLGLLLAGHSSARRSAKDFSVSLGVLLLGVALAGPRWGHRTTAARASTEDVVFVLDVSKSMMAGDARPSRLARAKASIAAFVKAKGTGSVGLVAFAGQAFLQCPLTRDYDAFHRTLEETDSSVIQVTGTDLGRALDEAEAAFAPNRSRKLVILLTDGEDLEAGGVEAAKRLARKGLVVHAVGVGTAAGGTISVLGPLGTLETLKDAEGAAVISRLDEATLAKVAEAAGGRFVMLGSAGEGMEALRLAVEAGTDSAHAGLQGVPREEWFVALALLLIVGETLLSTRRREAAPSA
ncbi:MAG: vWA domain-containing protein [Opitutales bacterium]